MREYSRRIGAYLSVAAILAITLYVPAPTAQGDGPAGSPVILKIGGQDKMKTRNPLPALANDVWTRDVLDRVYDKIGKVEANTERLLPYIVKGIDADEDGAFEVGEYGVFTKDPGSDQQVVVAYYDFNGVYFHDGVQADAGDLFFSYQLMAMNPRMNVDMRVLMDKAGRSGSNFTATRWLFMTFAPKVWNNEPPAGNASLRFAVRFQMQEPFALFNRSTLADCTLFPRHVWEGVGYRMDGTTKVTPLHTDFGMAIYPESDPRFGEGVPTTDPQHFIYLDSATPAIDSAEEWMPKDEDVIGTGPFYFDSFDEIQAVALVMKYQDYYTGNDSKTSQSIDPFISTFIHKPYIDGIFFVVYTSPTLGLLALLSGNINFYHWNVAPEFLPVLQGVPGIQLWMTDNPGFAYLEYNIRRPAVGTWHWGQVDQFDVGLHFRRAMSHLIDKAKIQKDNLQGYGIPGLVPVSPNNVKFYNASLSGYIFNSTAAEYELNLAHQDALWLAGHGGPPEAALWYTRDASNKVIMPGIGTATFYLWCPNADYDAILAISCTMLATEMQNLGIQVMAKPTAYSAVLMMTYAHDFDMYMLPQRITTNDPDYLYDMFHSSNAASGENYGGFNDPLSDWILDGSRMALNESIRVELLKWEQGVIANSLPRDTLYFRTNIEATNESCITGWTRDLGTIWNYWSLLNVFNTCHNNAPVAYFTITPPSGTNQTIFHFDASACADAEDPSSSLSVRWDFEDDAVWDTSWSTVKTVQHQYTSAGTYTVRLEVRDTGLETSSTTRQVVVVDDTNPPTVSISSPVEKQVFSGTPILVTGTAADTGGSGLQKVEVRVNAGSWTQAVGTASWTATMPLTSGDNLIEARAWDNAGLQSPVDNVTVELNTWPAAGFTISPAKGNTTTPFTMTSTSTDEEDSQSALYVRWDFEDDGVFDTNWLNISTAQHTYPHPGFYTIRLEVKDSGNLTNSTTLEQKVGLAPPFNLMVVAGGAEGSVRLSWEHPTPEDVDSYTVSAYDSKDAAVPFMSFNKTPTTYPIITTVGGLEPGVTYWFEVVAFNKTVGESDTSARIPGMAEKSPTVDSVPIIAAAMIAAIAVILVAIFLLRRKRKKETPTEGEKKAEGGPAT